MPVVGRKPDIFLVYGHYFNLLLNAIAFLNQHYMNHILAMSLKSCEQPGS